MKPFNLVFCKFFDLIIIVDLHFAAVCPVADMNFKRFNLSPGMMPYYVEAIADGHVLIAHDHVIKLFLEAMFFTNILQNIAVIIFLMSKSSDIFIRNPQCAFRKAQAPVKIRQYGNGIYKP